MRAYIVPEFGASGSIAERPIPQPEEGQILVRVKAAALNAMDPLVPTGMFRDWLEHRLPITPGSDYAGTVEAVGPGVVGLAVGDEVFGDLREALRGGGELRRVHDRERRPGGEATDRALGRGSRGHPSRGRARPSRPSTPAGSARATRS